MPKIHVIFPICLLLISKGACEKGNNQANSSPADVYDHEILNGNVLLSAKDRQSAEVSTTRNCFDSASDAVHEKNGSSFWTCVFRKVFGSDEAAGGKRPKQSCSATTASKKDPFADYEYSKCGRSTGYDIIKDKVCQECTLKPSVTGPEGYNKCKEIRIRKEVRDLTKEELADLIEAFSTITATKAPNSSKTIYQTLVEATVRGRHLGLINGTAAFLPWYRKCLYELENELRKVKPNVTIPYWDWSLDSQMPEKSIVFSPSFFGASAPDVSACVYGELLKGIECVKRVWKKDLVPSFPSPDVLRVLLAGAKNFEDLSTRLEVLQGMVEVSIGGVAASSESGQKPLGDLAGIKAANDPLFWLIAAFTDKLWASAFQRNDCVKMPQDDEIPLWHFTGTSAKHLESISTLCYIYAPSSIYRKTLSLMGFPMKPLPCNKCGNPAKKCTCGCTCSATVTATVEDGYLNDICPSGGNEDSQDYTITETETQSHDPTELPPSAAVSGGCECSSEANAAAESKPVKCTGEKHAHLLTKCSTSSFRLPKSVKELEMLYEEISKRFKIRKLIINAYSRRSTNMLRLPKPLPCYFLSMNRLDSKQVHDIEAELIKTVVVLNAAIAAGRYIPYGVSFKTLNSGMANHSHDICMSSGVPLGETERKIGLSCVFLVVIGALVLF